MKLLKLLFRNSFRHPLRTVLTILGLAIAIMSFSVIRTAINAWYVGAEASSPNRLVTRNAVSLIFDMPLAYKERIANADGVTGISLAQWFGGIYVEPSNFFAQFAVEHDSYFDLYPEFLVPEDQMAAFMAERNAVLVGQKLADRFGWSVGDNVRLTGTIYPGDWDFVIRGIYTGKFETTDENTWFSRWDYLDERMRVETPGRAGRVGTYIIQIDDPSRAAEISQAVDAMFENSIAETLTETEEAFNLSFVAMGSQIVLGLQIVSAMVIGVVLLVLGNTMAMTARERVSEYAVMKSLGFQSYHLVGLIAGESMLIAIMGGALGLLISVPINGVLGVALSMMFPVVKMDALTFIMSAVISGGVGLIAAIFPTLKAVRTPIVEGLRIVD